MKFSIHQYILKDLDLSTKDIVLSWRNSDNIRKYMYKDHIISAREHDLWFKKVKSEKNFKPLVLFFEKNPIGFVNFYALDNNNKSGYWTFYLGENVKKGTGLVFEYMALNYFFYNLQYKKLTCEVLSFNYSVVTLHKKFGFLEEGVLINHFTRNNQRWNIHILSTFKSDWDVKKKEIEVKFLE